MIQTAKSEAVRSAPYVGAGGVGGALMVIADRLHVGLKPEEVLYLSLAIGWGVHAVIRYGRPIAAAVYKKLLLLVGASVLLLAFCTTASASPARIVLSCTSSTSVYVAETDSILDVCSDPDVYMDAGITFDGVVLQMNRPREIVVGFSAGLGYGLRWSPVWWTYTPSFISVDLFAGGGYAVDDKALTISLLLKLTMIDWIGVGGGAAHSFGLADQPDSTRWLMTYGLAKSF